MQRVRLMCWCQSCVSGAHLPAFAAAEGGLLAEQGLEVEFVPAAATPDWTLRGFTRESRRSRPGTRSLRLPRLRTCSRPRAMRGDACRLDSPRYPISATPLLLSCATIQISRCQRTWRALGLGAY